MLRSNRPEVFCKKGVLGNFAKFTGKHLCQINTLLKKRLWHSWCFLVNFAKFSRAPFFIEHLWWMLLCVENQKLSNNIFIVRFT